MVLVPALVGVAFVVSWCTLPDRFVQLLTIYIVLTTAYSLYLKRVAVVDVLLLAGLYTLRVLAGIAAAHVRFSTWLLAFSMFLFLSLAFLKRYTEVSAMAPPDGEQVRRRGYLRGDREWLGSMGGASGYLSVLVLALYINSEQVVALYRHAAATSGWPARCCSSGPAACGCWPTAAGSTTTRSSPRCAIR